MNLRLSAAILFAAACSEAAHAQEQVFFGNLHSHSALSDGLGTPEEAFDHARAAGLHFLALTEHNHREAIGADDVGIGTDASLYTSLKNTAASKSVNGQFIALYGQEFSSIGKGNHVNVFDVGDVITAPNGRFDTLLDFLSTHQDSLGNDVLLMLNHPSERPEVIAREYGRDDFNGVQDWVKKMGARARLIQLINGPALQDGVDNPPSRPDEDNFRKFLNMGFMVAPTADQDNHFKNWGSATPARTAIVATDLTKASILDALNRRHVYATQDKNLRVIIKVNGQLCGDVIPLQPAQSSLVIGYSITDDDEPNASYTLRVFRDSVGGEAAKEDESFPIDQQGSGTFDTLNGPAEPEFLYFQVVQIGEDGESDSAWTAPVWFRNTGETVVATSNENIGLVPPGAAEPAPIDPDLAIGSRQSNSYHLSTACLDAQRIKRSNIINGSEARRGRTLHPGCPRTTGSR